jgi:NADPH-dependent glutamate synthase beta subunit-like oxidoreductase
MDNRHRQTANNIAALLQDIASGLAHEAHISAIESHIGLLDAPQNPAACRQAGGVLRQLLEENQEVIASHIQSQNCPSGDCDVLTPAPCHMACPAGIDVPTYVTLIGQGRDAEAIQEIRKVNPFPWVCGLVCTRPCEFECVRGQIDAPVSIKFLKAFAADKAFAEGTYLNPEKETDKPQKVCVIGAGPGGLSAAYYLALKGYPVRVLEALPKPGGMLMVGIPRYRLPEKVIQAEVDMLQQLGVEIQYNTRFGRDVDLAQLKQEGFEAFFFAIGAHKAYRLGLPGEDDYPQVIEAVEFLRQVALGEGRLPGERVVIIGGGNVAIDAARTCIRMGSREVTIAYRRSRKEMPADHEEIEHAEEEGVKLLLLTIPTAIDGQKGQLQGLRCVQAELVKKEGSARMSPVEIPGSDFLLEADAVIAAIGQSVDKTGVEAGFNGHQGISWTRWNTFEVNSMSMETTAPGVFAAGDAVTGPATVIQAIAGGKRAAEGIDRYFKGLPQPKYLPVPPRQQRTPWIEVSASAKMNLARARMPMLEMEKRLTTDKQVELGYSEEAVRLEAKRCLRCDICKRCGTCVEVCRDMMGIHALEMGYVGQENGATDFEATANRCILCGACAANCPTNAIQIIDREGERMLSLCGTILNRDKLLYCKDCGEVLGTAKHVAYMQERTTDMDTVVGEGQLCPVCARRQRARHMAETLLA